MLAQSFKSAADLGITPPELRALIQVLGMLERGELVNTSRYFVSCDNGFHMGTSGNGCGTPACIGGWVATLMGLECQSDYLHHYGSSRPHLNPGMNELYWNENACEAPATVAQAAMALRSYLTTGHANWRLALSPSPHETTE